MLLLSNIGLAYIFEFIIFNILKSYRYCPKVFKNNYLDNVFGAILSQAIIVPFTSIFITAFQLRWKAKLAFGLYFALIESYFLNLGIFHNNWWKTLYTGLLIPVYFFISDVSYQHLNKGTSSMITLALFNSILITRVNILYVLAVLKKLRFGFGKFRTWKNHFVIAPIYSIVLAAFSTWSIKQNTILAKLRILLFSSSLDWLLKKTGILKTYYKRPYQSILFHIINLLCTIQYDKCLSLVELCRNQRKEEGLN